MSAPDLTDTTLSIEAVRRIVERIRPYLAHADPAIQGAVLAELLSLWLAGHYLGGHEAIEALLTAHIDMVRRLTAVNVEALVAEHRQ